MGSLRVRGHLTGPTGRSENAELLVGAGATQLAALLETVERRRGIFFSRSRNKMWRKGEEGGHHQAVKSIAPDCEEVLFDPAEVYKQ